MQEKSSSQAKNAYARVLQSDRHESVVDMSDKSANESSTNCSRRRMIPSEVMSILRLYFATTTFTGLKSYPNGTEPGYSVRTSSSRRDEKVSSGMRLQGRSRRRRRAAHDARRRARPGRCVFEIPGQDRRAARREARKDAGPYRRDGRAVVEGASSAARATPQMEEQAFRQHRRDARLRARRRKRGRPQRAQQNARRGVQTIWAYRKSGLTGRYYDLLRETVQARKRALLECGRAKGSVFECVVGKSGVSISKWKSNAALVKHAKKHASDFGIDYRSSEGQRAYGERCALIVKDCDSYAIVHDMAGQGSDECMILLQGRICCRGQFV